MKDNSYTRYDARRSWGERRADDVQERNSGCGCSRSERSGYGSENVNRTRNDEYSYERSTRSDWSRTGCGCSGRDNDEQYDRSDRSAPNSRTGCGCSGKNNDEQYDRSDRSTRNSRTGCGCSGKNNDEQYDRSDRSARNSRTGCGCSRNSASDRRDGCARAERDNPSRNGCPRECHELMNRLQKLDFSIQETVLYLDAYPDCCEAKAHYHQLVKEREEVAEEYEHKCGPLNAMGNVSTTSWDWVDAPWPWHHDFPGNRKA